jgi:hypothetical protein
MAAQHSLYEPASETIDSRDGGGLVLDVDADTVGLVGTKTKRSRPGGPRILYRIAAYLPFRLRRLLPLILIGGVYATIGVLFVVNYTAVLHLLQELSAWLNEHGLGYVVVIFVVYSINSGFLY